MPISDPQTSRNRLVAFSQQDWVLYVLAQAQARSILKRTGTPSLEWPNFDSRLDSRVHHIAHRLLWGSLELLEAEEFEDDARRCLTIGAEALEFLYADTSMPAALRTEELLRASFGYYIGGHSARAFVLLNDMLEDLLPMPIMHQLAVAVLRRDLHDARRLFFDVFSDDDYSDTSIAAQLAEGSLQDSDAVTRIITRSVASAVCCFLEFLKTGDRPCLTEASELIDNSIHLAREFHFVDLWWWAYCIRFLFREMNGNSFWVQLAPLLSGDTPDGLVGKYIKAGLRHDPPVVDLWPSQKRAVNMVASESRDNFCLRMPTSSGKTRIAELTILRFLLDNRDNPMAKCIYIAPFRSLAVEIEKTLKMSLVPLGVRVSEVYGGFEISPSERLEVTESRVLVATPEKLDALLRFIPEMGDSIGLLIIDEGHIVDPNERGLRFEILIQRLLKQLQPRGCRFLFISAVLPNAEQFAEWITGSSDNLVRSNWRPSRLMIGRLNWDGHRIELSYTHANQQPLRQECFIRRFVDSRTCKGVPGFGRRRKPFPRDYREAMAAATISFALDGTTLVFVPQARNVTPAARDILQAAGHLRHLAEDADEHFEIPIPGIGTIPWNRCQQVITEELGDESELLDLFKKGIVVHHANLPRRVRLAVEHAIREGVARIVVATTTLGQGVNLPIRTVVVRGLHHGRNQDVSPLTFWNICGRAGRAMLENEGQILFCVDRTNDTHVRNRKERSIVKVTGTLQSYVVESALRLALVMIEKIWETEHSSTDLEELTLRLAENNLDWIENPENRTRLEDLLDILDGHLLTLSNEFDIDGATPDRLQEILHGSLLFLQLRDDPRNALDENASVGLLQSRMRYVCGVIPDPVQRSRLYKLGMRLSSCRYVEARREELRQFLEKMTDWDEWNDTQRADFLWSFAEILLDIEDVMPNPLPDGTDTIVRLWLLGQTASEISNDPKVKDSWDDPTEVALFIEDVCGYRLPWAGNSVLAYLLDQTDDGAAILPEVSSFISAIYKYGMVSPQGTCIMPRIDTRRDLAIEVARVCPYTYHLPNEIVTWFMDVSFEELIKDGISEGIAAEIVEIRDSRERYANATTSQGRNACVTVRTSQQVPDDVERISRVLLYVGDDNTASVYSLSGFYLGAVEWTQPIPEWWNRSDLHEAIVTQIEQQADSSRLTIQLNEL